MWAWVKLDQGKFRALSRAICKKLKTSTSNKSKIAGTTSKLWYIYIFKTSKLFLIVGQWAKHTRGEYLNPMSWRVVDNEGQVLVQRFSINRLCQLILKASKKFMNSKKNPSDHKRIMLSIFIKIILLWMWKNKTLPWCTVPYFCHCAGSCLWP